MTAVAEESVIIDQPGIYDGLDEQRYHADPVPATSLSHSGAKHLLPPSTPAQFAWDRAHPPEPSKSMELGTAAHKLVLGTGPELAVVDATDWRTKAAKDEATEIRARGGVPLLPEQMAVVRAMAAALRAHETASALFDPERGGRPEQSVFWPDDETGIWRRCRLDWMPDLDGPMPIIADYKTSATLDDRAIVRHMADFRYFMQSPWYVDGLAAITGEQYPFVFVFQQTSPPYLVRIAQLDERGMETGRRYNRAACQRFRDCTQAGVWPGYEDEVLQVELPPWIERGVF